VSNTDTNTNTQRFPLEVLIERRGGRSRVVTVKTEKALEKLMAKVADDGDEIVGVRSADR